GQIEKGVVAKAEPVTAYTTMEKGLLTTYEAEGNRSLAEIPHRLKPLRQHFGKLAPATIDEATIKEYIVRRLRAKAARATIKYELALLHRMLFLVRKRLGGMPDFPTFTVGDNARKGFCNEQEIERVISHLPAHLKPLVRALYVTGWRSNEMKHLEWRNVDFADGALMLDGSQTK